ETVAGFTYPRAARRGRLTYLANARRPTDEDRISTPHLHKPYHPKAVESRWFQVWNQQGYFHASPAHPGQPYCIVIPPPNVTGSLHVGHALNHSLQDILIRWRRMQGRNVLWLPGTDHAGIATQNVVEKQLIA